jgi:hypothetical protein
LGRVGSERQVGDREGVDTLVVVVHVLLEGVEIEFAEVVFGDHSHADAFVALLLLLRLRLLLLLLLLLLRNLKLRGVEVHEFGLDVFLGRLRLRLHGCLLLGLRLLRLLLRSRCSLRSLLLELINVQSRRVGADVVNEWGECRVAKEGLDEATVALVFLKNAGVFAAQVVGVLSLECDFAFELANVFCILLVCWSCNVLIGNTTYPFFLSGMHEQRPCF